MYETSGALTIALPSALVLLVALPLLWSIAVLTAGRRPTLAARIALAGSAGTLGWAIFVAVRTAAAARSGPRHILGQNLGSILRIGHLDLGFELQCDALAAVAVVVTAAVVFASVLRSIWADRVHRGLAFVGLLATGANLVFLAEGFAPLAIGLGLTTVSAFAIARGASVVTMTTALAGDACAVFALWFLFWALGGSFSATAGYEAEPAARFVLVAVPAPPTGPTSSLSMTTYPGATVTVDDGPPLPGEPLRAPFAVAVEPSLYTFRIAPSAGAADVVVPRVAVARGRAYTLAPHGPTLSLRSLVDQINVPRPLANGASIDARSLLATRSIGGFRATFIVAVLFAAAFAARVLAAASRRRALPLALVIEAAIPAFVALRLAPLFDPHAVDGAALAITGALVALVCAGHAAAARDPFSVTRAVLAATSAIVVAAAGIGEVPGGLEILVASVLSAAGALAALEATRDIRWLGVACAASVGLLPVSGISSGVVAVLARAVDPSLTWRSFGLGITIAVVVTVALCAVGAFRMHDAIIADPRGALGTRATSALALVLSSLALASGVLLGAGTSPFGGREVPVSARMLDSPVVRGDAWTGLPLAIVAPAIGLFLARRAWASAEAFGAAEHPARVLRRAAVVVARFARFLGDGAMTLDREVLGDAVALAASGVVALGRGVTRVDRAVIQRAAGAPTKRLADVATHRLGLDHPRTLARFVAVAVFLMVALLALVVLSSVLLG